MHINRLTIFSPLTLGACALLVAACLPLSADAHVSIVNKEAKVGARHSLLMRVPHGCAGSETTGIDIVIPDGVLDVRPQPKAGWTIKTSKAEYGKPYTMRNQTVSHGIQTLSWTGGALPDDFYEEFLFNVYLSAELPANTSLFFPTLQHCANGQVDWSDLPSKDGAAHAHDHEGNTGPAPRLLLVP